MGVLLAGEYDGLTVPTVASGPVPTWRRKFPCDGLARFPHPWGSLPEDPWDRAAAALAGPLHEAALAFHGPDLGLWTDRLCWRPGDTAPRRLRSVLLQAATLAEPV